MSDHRVLIVDDEEAARQGLSEVIASWGYVTETAADGRDATERVESFAPLVVITDVVMPKMSGREFANQLMQIRPNTRLLYVSGYADDVVLQNGISKEGMFFLQKPYSLKQLARKVQALMATPLRT